MRSLVVVVVSCLVTMVMTQTYTLSAVFDDYLNNPFAIAVGVVRRTSSGGFFSTYSYSVTYRVVTTFSSSLARSVLESAKNYNYSLSYPGNAFDQYYSISSTDYSAFIRGDYRLAITAPNGVTYRQNFVIDGFENVAVLKSLDSKNTNDVGVLLTRYLSANTYVLKSISTLNSPKYNILYGISNCYNAPVRYSYTGSTVLVNNSITADSNYVTAVASGVTLHGKLASGWTSVYADVPSCPTSAPTPFVEFWTTNNIIYVSVGSSFGFCLLCCCSCCLFFCCRRYINNNRRNGTNYYQFTTTPVAPSYAMNEVQYAHRSSYTPPTESYEPPQYVPPTQISSRAQSVTFGDNPVFDPVTGTFRPQQEQKVHFDPVTGEFRAF